MPEPLWTYLTALLYFTEGSSCLAMAQALATASHARWTRMLTGHGSGQTLLDVAWRALFTVVGGELIVEDTVVEKPHAAWLEEAAGVWSTQQHQVVLGMPVGRLVWTTGLVRMPLAFRIWKTGGPSTCESAWELLRAPVTGSQSNREWSGSLRGIPRSRC
jgi:hypothetical protein